MNTWGEKYKVTVFGESHGDLVGAVIDGVPAGIEMCRDMFMPDIYRRRAGEVGTTSRIEKDNPEIVSGLYKGFSTGAPVTIVFSNEDKNSDSYDIFKEIPRPGHADFTASVRYNSFNDIRGGGEFSGRMMLPVVAAGVIAKKILNGISINAKLIEIGGIEVLNTNPYDDENLKRLMEDVIAEGDSVGGVIECVIENIPAGVGNPLFDSIESMISSLIFSIPGVRGIEFGDGFRATRMKGSEHNDPFIDKEGRTSKNGAGGINGGISNGNPIIFRVAVKPTSSIPKRQLTFNFTKQQMDELSVTGRHDACFALRVPVIVEAVTAIALCQF